MPAIPWRIQFELALIPVYGPERAKRSSSVLLPAILRDFRKMLTKSAPGVIVSEDYNTEDRLTVIHLTGERILSRRGEMLVLRSLRVGSQEITLSGVIEGRPGEQS